MHREIAFSASQSSPGLIDFLSSNLGPEQSPFVNNPRIWFNNSEVSEPLSPVNWIVWGAHYEDDLWRFVDHFYTVTPNRVAGQANGLTDASETLGLLPLPVANSYAWGALPGILRPDIGYASQLNTENWPSARNYQFLALTESEPEDREANLAHMLYALGHVIHLNQDLAQPEHVRNDEHPFRHSIEVFGERDYLHQTDAFPQQPRGWAYWRDEAGFKRLLDFWDRGKFSGGSSAGLDADARGDLGQKVGLAEFSNGNFIGQDATYSEFFKPGNKHHFPFPSLKDTDQPQLKPGMSWANFVDSSTLADGTQGQRVYLKKLGAGIHMEKHSVLNYLGAMNMGKMGALPGPTAVSINAPEVLQCYHSILIPKAIEYSAGILDYFFRGRIQIVDVSWDDTQYEITIRNQSGQTLANGGKFFVLKESVNGDRAFVTSQNGVPLTQNLADDQTWQFSFSGPEVTTPTKFIVVYQGTIGLDGANASDPVDAGIAIAAKHFMLAKPDWSQLVWEDLMWDSEGEWSTGDFDFDGDAFSVVATSPPVPDVEEGEYLGTIEYNGVGGQSRVTLNGTITRHWYGGASFTVAVGFMGEDPFSDTHFSGQDPPVTLSNHAINFTVPSTDGLTKTIYVIVSWWASRVEGYAGDSGQVDVSGVLSNP